MTGSIARGSAGRHRRGTQGFVAAIAALSLAGCGSDSDSESAGAAKTTKVDVAYIEVTAAAPMMLGIKKGFFKQEGLDVQPRPTEAAATIPGVVSGNVDVSFTNPPAALLGKSNGLPLKTVAGIGGADDIDPHIQLVVRKNSDIQSLADLAGKKVAVDTLFQLPHLALLRSARSKGANPDDWKTTEIPYPAMTEALTSGKADAIMVAEPFLGQMLAAGDVRSIAGLYDGWEEGTPFSIYVTTEQFLAKEPKAVEAFARAIRKSNEYATANEAELRRIIPTFLEIPAAAAKEIRVPTFTATLDTAGLQRWKTVMKDAGVLKKDVDPAELTAGTPTDGTS